METNVFNDKSDEPHYERLVALLGETGSYLEKIIKHVKSQYGDVSEEWKFYSQKSGWIYKLMQKKRAIFYLRPFEGYFRLTFWMNDESVAEVVKSDLPQDMKDALANSRKYREGRSIQIHVKLLTHFERAMKLVAIKLDN